MSQSDLDKSTRAEVEQIRQVVVGFVLDNLLFGDESRLPDADQSLMAAGVVDSTGILELIEFIETEFGIEVADTEAVPENLDGLDRIGAFVIRKQRGDR